MTSRECVRGCRSFETTVDGKRPQHYAACADTECRGCVIREAADGALVCVGCAGRARRLVSDAPELLARVRSKTDPRSRRESGENQRTRPAHAPHVIDADHLDAILTLETVVGADVDGLVNDTAGVEWLSAAVLDRHKPYPDGTRDAWSVQDVMDRWGLEDKPEPHRYVFPDVEDGEEGEPIAVPEAFDPLINIRQAATRRGISERAIQKWVKRGLLKPHATITEGRSRVAYFWTSHVDAVDASMEEKRTKPLVNGIARK